MKRLLMILAFGLAIPMGAFGGEPVAYNIQLIRGSDQETSPVPNSKRIDPALAGTFHAVFKWRTYWEISSRRIELATAGATRVRLSPEREVEIDISDPAKRVVTAFLNGKVVQRTVCPRSECRTLIGGDRDGNTAWFIIVSRKKSEE